MDFREELILERQVKPGIVMGVITGDAPLSEDTFAWGMHHINTRLFRALNENIRMIIITNPHGNKIDAGLQKKCVLVRYSYTYKLLRRSFRYFFTNSKSELIVFKMLLPNLVRRLKEQKINWLFCPCGVDPVDLGRAVLLAEASKLPIAAYLVDDFLEGALCSGSKEHLSIAKKDVPGWINRIDKVFTISEGLQALIKERYDKNASVLPVPYNLDRDVARGSVKADKKQIIYVGSLSHFYLDGLKQLATLIDALNEKEEDPIILRLASFASTEKAKRIIGDFKCIRSAPCNGIDILHSEISQSLATFIPYSFDPKYKTMVETSFPNKILPSLASSRFILIYGPADSTSVRYFQKHDLPSVLCTEDMKALQDIILRQAAEKKNYSERYREVIRRYHSSDRVAEKVIVEL